MNEEAIQTQLSVDVPPEDASGYRAKAKRELFRRWVQAQRSGTTAEIHRALSAFVASCGCPVSDCPNYTTVLRWLTIVTPAEQVEDRGQDSREGSETSLIKHADTDVQNNSFAHDTARDAFLEAESYYHQLLGALWRHRKPDLDEFRIEKRFNKPAKKTRGHGMTSDWSMKLPDAKSELSGW